MTNLRVLRRLKNVSVKELAKRAGISAMTVYRYETGKRTPDVGIAQRIAEALSVTVDDLIKKAG